MMSTASPPEEATDRPFSFDNDFERLERERAERAERAEVASGEAPIEGTVEGYAPPGSGSAPSADEDRTLGDRVGAGANAQDESGDAGHAEAPVPAGVAAMSAIPPMAPPGTSPRRQRGVVGRNLRRPGSASANASPGAIASAAAARHAKRPYDLGADRAATGGAGRDIGAAVATGAGLLALFVICYLVAPAALLALSAVVILGCALEAFAMFQRAGFRPATLLGALGSGGAVVAAYWRGSAALPVVLVVVVCASLVWYLARVVEARPVVNVAVTVFGFAWVGMLGSFAGLMLAAPRGEHLFLGAVIPTVVADLAAWFAGSRFGSHPLAPAVSPSKTWEGFAAGGIAALVAGAVIGSQVSPWGGVRHGLELGLVIAVVAPVGDLVQSMIKRDLAFEGLELAAPGPWRPVGPLRLAAAGFAGYLLPGNSAPSCLRARQQVPLHRGQHRLDRHPGAGSSARQPRHVRGDGARGPVVGSAFSRNKRARCTRGRWPSPTRRRRTSSPPSSPMAPRSSQARARSPR